MGGAAGCGLGLVAALVAGSTRCAALCFPPCPWPPCRCPPPPPSPPPPALALAPAAATNRTCGEKILRRIGFSEMPLLLPTTRSVSARISCGKGGREVQGNAGKGSPVGSAQAHRRSSGRATTCFQQQALPPGPMLHSGTLPQLHTPQLSTRTAAPTKPTAPTPGGCGQSRSSACPGRAGTLPTRRRHWLLPLCRGQCHTAAAAGLLAPPLQTTTTTTPAPAS